MKQSKFLTSLFILFLSFSVYGQSIESETEDKTLSPFFFVKSDDPSVDQLPLQSTSADVNIAGVIADVRVTQVYKNEGKKPLEAIYIFPASTRAAVYSMKMTIGERTIIAKIEKKEEARKQYEQAKAEGKSASLLEQQRPNVFQMNVANIMPGDIIKVEMFYTELLIPTDNIYEFVYPTVVGPRYSNTPESQAAPSEEWVKNPYLHEGEQAPYRFNITAGISAGMPIQDIFCTSHKVNINYEQKSQAVINLAPDQENSGNKDFILKYRLAGNKIESGLLLYEGEKENFFLMMMQPPKRVETDQIPPREYIFIVDVSGSMHGFPLDISKKLMSDLIGNLKPKDQFNVLLFASGSTLMSQTSVQATEQNIQKAFRIIDSERGGGGTELLPALKRALALPKSEGYSRTVVIVTDGYVSVEKEAFDLIRNNLNKANMFAFGIGSSVNRFIIEGMARAGMGEPFVITKQTEAQAKAEKFRNYIELPILTEIQTGFEGFDTYDVEPPSIADVLAERPIILFGKYKGDAKGTITVKGYTGDKNKYRQNIKVSDVEPMEKNSALRYLWARHRISILGDYNKLQQDDERIMEITNLGLTYNLLTDYTSFIAIDSEVRNVDGKLTTVKQPLPLPEGVSDYAVGAGVMKTMGVMGGRAKPAIPANALQEIVFDVAPEMEKKEDKKKTSAVKLGIITLNSKKVDKEKIIKAIQKNIQQIKLCYEKAVLTNSNLTGKMVLKITLLANGNVKNVSLVSTELKDKKMEKCILDSMKLWKLESFTGTEEVEITCPFEFGLN